MAKGWPICKERREPEPVKSLMKLRASVTSSKHYGCSTLISSAQCISMRKPLDVWQWPTIISVSSTNRIKKRTWQSGTLRKSLKSRSKWSIAQLKRQIWHRAILIYAQSTQRCASMRLPSTMQSCPSKSLTLSMRPGIPTTWEMSKNVSNLPLSCQQLFIMLQ
jgi:hypothetical protein